jgi:hypothetical protein
VKRSWIILVAIAMALAIAAPATGKKPPKPNPAAATVAVYVEAGPLWVHEPGDIIAYTVHVQNKDQDTAATITVTPTDFTADPPAEVVLELEGGATGVAVMHRTLYEDDFPPPGTEGEIIGTVQITYTLGDQVGDLAVEASTVADRYLECNPDSFGSFDEVLLTAGDACIWKPGSVGDSDWRVTVRPDPNNRLPIQMAVTMRDHVPGNWCTTDGSGGGAYTRWDRNDPDPSLVLDVYLPSDGVCLGGGEWPIGNPDSFYLWIRSDALVTIEGPLPQE